MRDLLTRILATSARRWNTIHYHGVGFLWALLGLAGAFALAVLIGLSIGVPLIFVLDQMFQTPFSLWKVAVVGVAAAIVLVVSLRRRRLQR